MQRRLQRARRVPRRLLVRQGASRRNVIGDNKVWHALSGLDRLSALKRRFGDFYDQHEIGAKPFTLSLVLATTIALFNLIEEYAFQQSIGLHVILDEDADIEFDLWAPDGANRAIHELVHLSEEDAFSILDNMTYLTGPTPYLYGIGVTTALDGNDGPFGLLTMALWHMAQGTEWDTGVDVRQMHGLFVQEAREQLHLIERLPRLPMLSERVCDELLVPDVFDAGQLVRYAFGKTGIGLADVSDYEYEVSYGGQNDFTWHDLEGIEREANQARCIHDAYQRWEDRVERNPERELKILAKALRQAVRAAEEQEDDEEQTLAEILAEEIAAT